MNALEIACRNFLANQGLDEQTVDLLAQDQDYTARFAEFVAPFLAGPYGCLAPIEQVLTATVEQTTDPELVEQYIDGYTNALNDVVLHIDNSVITVPCECAAASVHTVLGALKSDIQNQINSLDAGTADDPADDVPVFDLFSLFGLSGVEFVDLEQAEG